MKGGRVTYPWGTPPPISKKSIRTGLLDFDRYRETFLRVRPLVGGDRVPFILNVPQCRLHARVEDERNTFRMVRALVPKARQMGVSKYVGVRYFHRTATEFGRRAQIVAHR